MKKKILSFVLVLTLLMGVVSPLSKVYASDVYIDLDEHLEFLYSGDVPTVGSVDGEWSIIALARSSYDVSDDYYESYYNNVKKHIDKLKDKKRISNNRLDKNKSTENSRLILALTAIGIDPRNVEGLNLVSGLDDINYLKKQGINGPIWALIAIDSHNYELENLSREQLIDEIISAQNSDGGWGLNEKSGSDIDITAMAIQSLGKYSSKKVLDSLENGFNYLSNKQLKDGNFKSGYGEISLESAAQVLMALISNDKNYTDESLVKDKNLLEVIKTFEAYEGGFKHILEGQRDGMATEQGIYALVANDRQKRGKTFIYDMSDVEFNKVEEDEKYDFEEFKDFQINGFKNSQIEAKYIDGNYKFEEILSNQKVKKDIIWKINFNKKPSKDGIDAVVIEGQKGIINVNIGRDENNSLVIKSDEYEMGDYALKIYLKNGNKYINTFEITD